MTAETTARRLHEAAYRISKHLKNRKRTHEQDRSNVYDDERLEITSYDRTKFVKVRLRIKGKMVEVYSASGLLPEIPYVHKPGKWIDQIMALNPAAIEAEEKANREERDTYDRETQERYEPIDDESVFKEPTRKRSWLWRITGHR